MHHTFTLTQPYIELNKLLKHLDLVDSGAHAKEEILSGAVTVNGKVELRIRNKLVAWDSVHYDGHEISLVV